MKQQAIVRFWRAFPETESVLARTTWEYLQGTFLWAFPVIVPVEGTRGATFRRSVYCYRLGEQVATIHLLEKKERVCFLSVVMNTPLFQCIEKVLEANHFFSGAPVIPEETAPFLYASGWGDLIPPGTDPVLVRAGFCLSPRVFPHSGIATR